MARPSILNLIKSSSSGSGASNSSVFDAAKAAVTGKIAAIIASGEEIRLLIPASSNFGNQASSILVMNRLIAMGATNIRIIYNPAASTWSKLCVLILGLPTDPVTSFVVGGATINFSLDPGFFSPPPPQVTLGISGGWDGNKGSVVDLLNVKSFCCLQPYLWTGTDDLPSSNVLYFPSSISGKMTAVDFPKMLQVPLRAYYTPNPTLSPEQLAVFATLDARKELCVQAVMKLVAAKKSNLIPIYFSPGRPLGQFEDIFFNLITGIFYYKQISKDIRPVLIPMLATSDPGAYDFLRDMLLGKVVLDGGTVSSGDIYPERSQYLEERNYLELFKRVCILDTAELCTGPNITAAMASGKYDIVIAAIENVPKVVFDYVFSLSTMFHVFEGMGTASLALNMGIPFLHLQTSGAPNIYRLPPFGKDPDADPFGKYCLQASLALGMDPPVWELVLSNVGAGGLPNVVIGKFLNAVMTPESALLGDFGALRTFYHNEEQDKLLGGLTAWLSILNSGT